MLTLLEAKEFGRRWVEAFNRRDIQAVLSHFAEECTFTSQRARAVAGKPTLHSRAELEAYWSAALSAIGHLRFTLDRVIHDPDSGSVVILYDAEIDDRRLRAAEIYRFDSSSRVVYGEAMYGAELKPGAR